jgi:hypothetical protein
MEFELDVKPTLANAFVILMIVVVGILLLKFTFNRVYVPGVSEAVNAL